MEDSIFKALTNEPHSGRVCEDSGLSSPDPTLENGQLLSLEILSQLPADLIGRPVEELDPYYRSKEKKETFLVISKNGTIHRFSFENAFNLWSPFTLIRRLNLFVTTSWIFDTLMILVLLGNIYTMIMITYRVENFTVIVDPIFVAVYSFEFIVKLLARGVIQEPFSCLRIYWNWLDVIILVTFPLVIVNIHFAHALMAVRILKLIPLVPRLRLEFDFMVSTCVWMLDLVILAPMIIFVFSVAFLQMYLGALTNKCMQEPLGGFNNIGVSWESYASNSANWYIEPGTSEYQLCSNSTESCPQNYTCIFGFGQNPYYDLSSFDSIFMSYLSTLRLVAQDFMEDLYRQILLTTGSFSIISFLSLFVFATFPFGVCAYALIGSSFLNAKRYLKIQISNSEEGFINLQSPKESFCLGCCDRVCPFWEMFSKFKQYLIYLEWFITVVIVFDISCLAFYHYGIDSQIDLFLRKANIVTFIVYLIEFLLKIIILSPKTYFKSCWNIYDFILVLIWSFELLMEDINISSAFGHSYDPSMRVFKLVPRISAAQIVFRIIGNSLKSFRALFEIFLLFILMFAIIGTSLHGKNYFESINKFNNQEIPRWNFIDFFHSYWMVVRILCGEWIEILWDTWYISGYIAIVYMGFVLVLGNFLLFNMSVAIIITTIQYLKSEEFKSAPEETTCDRILRKICFPYYWVNSKLNPEDGKLVDENETQTGDLEILHNQNSDRSRTDANVLGWRTFFQFKSSPHFLWISICVVCLSTFILVAFEHMHWELKFILNLGFAIYLTTEILLRLISGGIRNSLRLGWIFDLCILVDIILALAFNLRVYPTGFLYLQCLRPFMLFSRVEGLQVVAKGLFKEFFFVGKYIPALLLIWLGFGIPFVQVFNGSFYKCIDESSEQPDYRIIKNSADCQFTNYTWTNSGFNFDTIGNTFVSLFTVATFNGWLQVKADVSDARSLDEQPHREVNLGLLQFFALFIVFGVFMPLNILFGVVFHNLNKPAMFGIFMTETEKGEYAHKEQNPPPSIPEPIIPRPTSSCQRGWYDLVTNIKFETLLLVIIFIDVLNISVEHHGLGVNYYHRYIQYIHSLITFLYLCEFVVKLIAWRHFYFKQRINIFDFIVVLDMVVTIIFLNIASYAISFQILRPFRLIRIITYQPVRARLQKFQRFLRGFSLASSSLFNIFIFLATLFSTYALIGNTLFKNVHSSQVITNFQSVSGSIHTVFALFEYSGWDGLYYEFLQDGYSFSGPIFIILCLFTSFVLTCNLYFVLTLEVINQLKTPVPKKQDEPEEIPEVVVAASMTSNANTNEVSRDLNIQELKDSTENIPLA